MVKCESNTDTVIRYVRDLANQINQISDARVATRLDVDPQRLGHEVFSLLTNRKFTHLTRTKAEKYRQSVSPQLMRYIKKGDPIRLYYDIGPGYHASSSSCNRVLSFEVGLAELVLLRQVKQFLDALTGTYAPGAVFVLVIDNLCALYTNGVSVNSTEQYASKLQELIDEMGLADVIKLLIESREFSQNEYSRILTTCSNSEPPLLELTQCDKDNVERFLGRSCSEFEAQLRVRAYQKATYVTESLLATVVDGVRLTQRATSNTLGFRSFPGGDQRIQVGELALCLKGGQNPRPLLLTTRNRDQYHVDFLEIPSSVLTSFSWVTVASPKPHRLLSTR